MSITLTPELEADVLSRVSNGRFADPVEVLTEAMRLLKEHEKLAVLRALIQEAQDEVTLGNVYDWTPETMASIVAEAEQADALGLPLNDNFRP